MLQGSGTGIAVGYQISHDYMSRTTHHELKSLRQLKSLDCTGSAVINIKINMPSYRYI